MMLIFFSELMKFYRIISIALVPTIFYSIISKLLGVALIS